MLMILLSVVYVDDVYFEASILRIIHAFAFLSISLCLLPKDTLFQMEKRMVCQVL